MFVLALLIPFVVVWGFFWIDKKEFRDDIENLKKDHFVIRMPRVFTWAGWLTIFLFGGFLIWVIFFPNGTGGPVVIAGFAFFILLGVVMVWVAVAWRIDLYQDRDYFTLRTVFFKTYQIYYCDCISYKIEKEALILNTNKKTFRIAYIPSVVYLKGELDVRQIRRIM